ncbi:Ferritin heavy chain A [Chelonia mydas]|uniref:Ferritin n=1 Tax=Chelonia mydas TaxID=8469 RepID=M7BZI5_CHEMY|nr:Ferritin heavy chain A [Chelonia mydas]
MESQVCQNFHLDCEAAVNRMVNLELYASYVYLSMSFYFDRDDVALRHMAQFLKEQSHEEREHAEKFLKYQNKRGGRIVLQDIKKPERDEWGNSLEALQCALQLEKTVNQALLDLHKLATEKNDPHSYHFDGAVVVLRHVTQFLKEKSYEAKEYAERFLSPQNKRGGRIVLQEGYQGGGSLLLCITSAVCLVWQGKGEWKPERDEWGNSLEALQCDLQLEKTVNQALLDLQKLAMEKSDRCLCDFLDSEYLEKQVKAIKQVGDHLTNLKHLGVPQNGMGEYLFDKHTLGESS